MKELEEVWEANTESSLSMITVRKSIVEMTLYRLVYRGDQNKGGSGNPYKGGLEDYLHKMIDAIQQDRLREVGECIGYVGEYTMYNKYQDEFTFLIFQKAGVPQEQFDQLKGKITYKWYGANIKGKK